MRQTYGFSHRAGQKVRFLLGLLFSLSGSSDWKIVSNFPVKTKYGPLGPVLVIKF
jgi:hypothetical protein